MAKKSKRNRKKIYLAAIIALVVSLAVVFFVMAVDNSIVENPISQLSKEAVEFSVQDVCSVFAGQILHTIKDDGTCSSACRAECDARSMSYISSEFSEIEGDCNICRCRCR
jgi:predicted lipoprotein with Yx(FWY)xxD motif